MSEPDLTRLIKSIQDSAPATIALTTTKGKRTQFQCIFKESESPCFFLVFPSDQIPADVDFKKAAPFVGTDKNGDTVSFSASIIEQKNSRIYELVAKKTINPEDLRENFRVNIQTTITVSFDPEPGDNSQESWELDGKVLDLSQSGVLTVLPEECRNTESLFLEIDLTEPHKTIGVIGRLVRAKRIKKRRWLTSFHFEDISQEAVDNIATNCFAEQRRQLRENISIS